MKCGGLDRYTYKACRFRTGHEGYCLSEEPRLEETDAVRKRQIDDEEDEERRRRDRHGREVRQREGREG